MRNECCLEGQVIDHFSSNGIELHVEQLLNLNGEFQTLKARNPPDIYVRYIGWDGIRPNNQDWAFIYYKPSSGSKWFTFDSDCLEA